MADGSESSEECPESRLEASANALQSEIDRAVRELRASLGAMAKERRLHPSLMSVITLLDKVEFHVIFDPGDSAFELNEDAGVVSFRSSGLEAVLEGAETIVSEVGYESEEEAAHIRQLAVDLFITHELLHICQNFPHFQTVSEIKKGVPGIGLPMLDSAADIVAASICAHARHLALGDDSDEQFLRHFANTLVVSYAIVSIIFDARSKAEKRQRALGLLVSAVMIQALAEGQLRRENVNTVWKPNSPLFLLNIEASGAFNAFVVDEVPGILFTRHADASGELALKLWHSVGVLPVFETLGLIASLLKQIAVLGDAPPSA